MGVDCKMDIAGVSEGGDLRAVLEEVESCW
jgi:hypothetical protein